MTRFFKVAAAALLVASAEWMAVPVHACEPLDPGALGVAAATRKDAAGRSVALIHINGQGPFRFVIDTGANRSVISSALAAQLGLASSGEGVVHSIDSEAPATLVNVDSLSFGTLRLSQGDTPVLDGPMLADQHGLLGVDGMAGRLLHIDFIKHCVEVYESPSQMPMQGWLSVPARMRFGTMLTVEGDIMGVKVNVLIDTGSEISLGNERFREALRRVSARKVEYHNGHAFTFGFPLVLEKSIWVPSLHLGRAVNSSVTAYIGNFHVFDVWGLQAEPTLLVGMDVLASAREMAIDYENGVVLFRKRPYGNQ
jgi:predicted aspartyl protease